MQYLGGKARIAKKILPIILENRKEDQPFVDLFMGGGNISAEAGGVIIANDIHKPLIKMWEALKSGWIPPTYVDNLLYQQIKKHPDRYPDYLVGFVGFGCSFGGKWFGGYAKNKRGDNFSKTAREVVLRQINNMGDITFYNLPYYEVPLPEDSIVYCDPPYANTTKYKTGDFDHSIFWNWVRQTSKKHKVFVSEYRAPMDFVKLWEKKVKSSVTANSNTQQRTEGLYIHEINL